MRALRQAGHKVERLHPSPGDALERGDRFALKPRRTADLRRTNSSPIVEGVFTCDPRVMLRLGVRTTRITGKLGHRHTTQLGHKEPRGFAHLYYIALTLDTVPQHGAGQQRRRARLALYNCLAHNAATVPFYTIISPYSL
ncbi:hypothetical protein NDU88_008239 [Pleurodeles waltl]|uniref:Uncharacterized protein n=1 Tax=Pleurodeles waltl TaxID=8319 RepID=A0AAV7NXA2_PLEWA|nr:hypothetical protein NDU88_008239 [Pleurodeles waltl]